MGEARGRCPCWNPGAEPGGRTRGPNPGAFIPRHPANSYGRNPGNDRWITPPGSSRCQIRSKPWTYLPLESTRAQPSSQPGDRPGGSTRDLPACVGNSRCAGSPRFRFARAPGALRFAPHPLRRASLPLSAPGLLRVLRVASLRGTLRRPLRGSLAGGKQPSAACSFVSWRSFGRSFHGSMPGDQAGTASCLSHSHAEALRGCFASLRTPSDASAKGRAPPLRSVALW